MNPAGEGREKAVPVSNPSARSVCEPHDLNRLSGLAAAGPDSRGTRIWAPSTKKAVAEAVHNAHSRLHQELTGQSPLPNKRVYPHQ